MAARAGAEIGDERAAVVALTGDAEPDLLADLPGERVGRARMLELAEENNAPGQRAAEQLDGRRRARTPAGRSRCSASPTSSGSGSSSSSASASTRTTRSPPGATHVARIGRRARLLERHALDAVRFRGAGTDLTVGLLPESRWQGVESKTARRAPLRREHADRGGLHDAGRTAHRGPRALDAAARALRPASCAGSRCGSRAAASSTSRPTRAPT